MGTSKDIENINKVIEVLMKQSNVHVRDNENSFNSLRMANCILYAVVVAFLLMKKWKKKGNNQLKTSGIAEEIKRKQIYDNK